ILLGKPPIQPRRDQRVKIDLPPVRLLDQSWDEMAKAVLRHPTVANKQFLITIGDRSVTGLVARDQMVGPYQVPVSDCAVTSRDYAGVAGEAMAMGERTPLAVINAKAASRMAVAESITNIAGADVNGIDKIKLSANWMAACGVAGQDAALYDAVQSVGLELCPALGVSIPVGKDSLSMKTTWQEQSEEKSVVSPVSLIVTAFAPVEDVRQTVTPELKALDQETVVLFIDLAKGKKRLGGSIAAQVVNQYGDQVPDVEDPVLLKNAFAALRQLKDEQLVLAYHDKSDGGLWATLCEMSFASHTGISLQVDNLLIDSVDQMGIDDAKNWTEQVSGTRPERIMRALFNEELGMCIQVLRANRSRVVDILREHGLSPLTQQIATPNQEDTIEIYVDGKVFYRESRVALQDEWQKVSYHIAKMRDNPECVDAEYAKMSTKEGLVAQLSFTMPLSMPVIGGVKPKMAIWREQDMAGSVLPIVVSHGEGRAQFAEYIDPKSLPITLQYVDSQGKPTQSYPENPNGSPDAIAGMTTRDGRVTIMMPHPER
ncbi:unnamed protein product, partial [Darwinula stevensoni]